MDRLPRGRHQSVHISYKQHRKANAQKQYRPPTPFQYQILSNPTLTEAFSKLIVSVLLTETEKRLKFETGNKVGNKQYEFKSRIQLAHKNASLNLRNSDAVRQVLPEMHTKQPGYLHMEDQNYLGRLQTDFERLEIENNKNNTATNVGTSTSNTLTEASIRFRQQTTLPKKITHPTNHCPLHNTPIHNGSHRVRRNQKCLICKNAFKHQDKLIGLDKDSVRRFNYILILLLRNGNVTYNLEKNRLRCINNRHMRNAAMTLNNSTTSDPRRSHNNSSSSSR